MRQMIKYRSSRHAGADPATTPSQRRKGKVSFQGVAIREYNRILGDNPASDDGPPLGLDWEYTDVTRETNSAKAANLPKTLIHIDDYEQEAERRRRAQLTEICKLHEKEVKEILAFHKKEERRKRRANKGYGKDNDDSNASDDTLTEDQMKMLSAHWLKLQPLTAWERMEIILNETDCTRIDVEINDQQIRKTRKERRNTAASADSGVDEWRSMVEFFKRRYRRFKTGISKEKEQELLWESAKDYWSGGTSSCGSSNGSCSARSLRTSISSHLPSALKQVGNTAA